MPTELTITFTIAELNAILTAMSKRPWQEADPIIHKIREAAEKARDELEKKAGDEAE